MEPNKDTPQTETPEVVAETMTEKKRLSKPLVYGMGAFLFFIILVFGGLGLYGYMHRDVVAPGVFIGDMPIGGMSRDALKDFLSQMDEKILSTDILVDVETSDGEILHLSISSRISGGVDIPDQELFRMDVDVATEELFGYGKTPTVFGTGWSSLMLYLSPISLEVPTAEINRAELLAELQELVDPYTISSTNASILIKDTDPILFEITSSEQGVEYLFDTAIEAIALNWKSFVTPEVALSPVAAVPDILKEDLTELEDTIVTVLEQFPLSLTYTNSTTKQEFEWTIFKKQAANFLQPKRNGDIYLGVHEGRFLDYLATEVAPDVEVDPVNARFAMENGKVTEFKMAKDGIAIATSTMVNMMDSAIIDRNLPGASTSSLSLVIVASRPEISNEEVNDLGITELLGVGTSDFSGSPANRIGNIRNAISKLDGLLIAPGEEFSTIDHTKPYTIAGGYLPELVIKGDEIKPEVGGGLCQIGTTLFRMAMNSGLEILERRNHSLVVNHYNDLNNGLPGTDATIYDPAPDFRFKNDTGHHVLIDIEMDMSTGLLHFYLWGTNDGRSGSYSLPQVLRWYSPGPTEYKETADLAPGVKKCQGAFRGADTTFTYTRTLPSGEVEETVFESSYRPLPSICLVGIDPNAPQTCAPDDVDCIPAEAGDTESVDPLAEGEDTPPVAEGISTEETAEVPAT